MIMKHDEKRCSESLSTRYSRLVSSCLKQQAEMYAIDEEFREAKKLREKARKIGLSSDDYAAKWDELFDLQAGCCAICGRHASEVQLVMDHRHSDMLVRGLLCEKCNQGIGCLQDSSQLLTRAAKYLKRVP